MDEQQTSESDEVTRVPAPVTIDAVAESEHVIKVTWHWGAAQKRATHLKWQLGGQPVGSHDAPGDPTFYRVAGLNPNTQYEVLVFGREGDELSIESRRAVATTKPVSATPAAPTSLVGTATINSIQLTWLDPGGRASSYSLSYGFAPNGPVIKTETSNKIGHLIAGLRSITDYYIEVHSINSSGSSAPTRIVHRTLTPAMTGKQICSPGNLSGARKTTTSATLRWDEPYATCTLCPNASYYVIYGEGIATIAVNHSPYEITGLTPGREYRFSVRTKATESDVSEASQVSIGL